MENPSRSADATVSSLAADRSGNGTLLVIGIFKLVKAILFFVAAIGVFKMVHRDTQVELTKVLHVFRVDGDRKFVKDLMLKSNVIQDPQKKIIGGLLSLYAILFGIEGVGLLLERRWAEYFTVIMSATLIPLELYEIFHRTAHTANSHLTELVPEDQRPGFVFNRIFLLKLGALLLNMAIVWFLVVHIRRHKPGATTTVAGTLAPLRPAEALKIEAQP